MPEGFLLWWVKNRTSGWAGGPVFWLFGGAIVVVVESLAGWRALLWSTRYGCGFAMLESYGKGGFAADELFLKAGQRVMVPSAVWACARRGWQRFKNRATCWGQRPM